MRAFHAVLHAGAVALMAVFSQAEASAQAVGVSPMSRPEFDALFARVNNAGRWGERDERGTLNYITPEVRRAAAAEVKKGITVSLAREMVSGLPPGGFGPIKVEMLVVSDRLFYHGWAYTHIDALSHMPAYRGRGYNNAALEHAPPVGQNRNSVATMHDGLIARGVLVDLPALKGVSHVPPGGAIMASDFEAWEKRSGVRIRSGDVVLVRSGRWSTAAQNAKVERSAGVHPTAAAWLHARGAAALGDESGTDTSPSAVAGINSPLHVLALVAMGMPLIENLDLEQLAVEADAQQRWTFLLVIAPLRVRGATGSAVNPIAVF
jgi:kynurenine formamidase